MPAKKSNKKSSASVAKTASTAVKTPKTATKPNNTTKSAKTAKKPKMPRIHVSAELLARLTGEEQLRLSDIVSVFSILRNNTRTKKVVKTLGTREIRQTWSLVRAIARINGIKRDDLKAIEKSWDIISQDEMFLEMEPLEQQMAHKILEAKLNGQSEISYEVEDRPTAIEGLIQFLITLSENPEPMAKRAKALITAINVARRA